MSITQQNFDYLSNLIKTESGIVVGKDKMYLLQTRLSSISAKHDCADINGLTDKLRGFDPTKAIMNEVVDAMTTNESLFFRDQKPFEALKSAILPALEAENPGGTVHYWSAACSTGQEPYSIALTMHESGRGGRYRIEATDISDEALARAKQGVYSQFEVQRGMPIKMLLTYFAQENTQWRIKPDYQKNINFAKGNLLKPQRFAAKFDIVMCRNVLIYFDKPTKDIVLSNIIAATKPGGFLVLGGSENLLGLEAASHYDRFSDFPAVYRRKD